MPSSPLSKQHVSMKDPFKINFNEEFMRKELCLHVNPVQKVNVVAPTNSIRAMRKDEANIIRVKDAKKFVRTEENKRTRKIPLLDLSEIIDLTMELQHNLSEISSNILVAHQLQLSLIILEAFLAILLNSFYILMLFNSASHFRLPKHEAALFLIYQLFQSIINLLGITVTCMETIKEAKETQQIVNKLIIVTKDGNIQARLLQFSMQIQTSIPVFNVLGLFKIDASLLFSIAASTTTYLVILIQYSNIEDSSSG